MNLQQATMIAREHTGKMIGVAVEAGKFQVQEIEILKRGHTNVHPLSDWVSRDDIVNELLIVAAGDDEDLYYSIASRA